MKKTTQEFYIEISEILDKEHPEFLEEFKRRIASERPKQVFLWLQSEIEKIKISDKFDRLMTDFFYSIH